MASKSENELIKAAAEGDRERLLTCISKGRAPLN
jgi:hypothetical protein